MRCAAARDHRFSQTAVENPPADGEYPRRPGRAATTGRPWPAIFLKPGAALDKPTLGKLLAAFARHRPRLTAQASARLGSSSLAEDLLQDVWIKIEGAHPQAPVENPAGFIGQIANNAIRDHFRKERRRAAIDAEVQSLLWESDDDISAERRLIGRENLRAVCAALDELPAKTRSIFLMNRIENISHRSIARIYGMTDEAVYYHIRRALEHLAQLRDEMRG